jgi:hypothetical protein
MSVSSIISLRQRYTDRLQVALDVSHVPTSAAARPARGLVDHLLLEALLVENPVVHQFKTHNLGAFFPERCRGRRHGAGQDAADICMMATGGGEEDDVLMTLGVDFWAEHGGDHGDVGQVPEKT